MRLHMSGFFAFVSTLFTAVVLTANAPYVEQVAVHSLTSEPTAIVTNSPRVLPAAPTVEQGPVANLRFRLRATAYNSLKEQTNSTPFVTATGTRTRFGIVAVSRDLLGRDLPYGSLIRIRDLGSYHNGSGRGAFQDVLDSQETFIVEDTMHVRKQEQIDVWFAEYQTAVAWGVRQVEVEVVRYGRDGAELVPADEPTFEASPVLVASR